MKAPDLQEHWYQIWFDSPYYHLLYKHRDEEEARKFLDNLLAFLNPPPKSKILDVACGIGRHALHLSQKGMDVTGIDLSERNIAKAKKLEGPQLHFIRNDMRDV